MAFRLFVRFYYVHSIG